MDSKRAAYQVVKAKLKSSPLRLSLRSFETLDDMKAEELRYWQQQAGHERMSTTAELTRHAYGLKTGRIHVRRLQRTLVRLERM